MALTIESSAFANGGEIPKQYSCEGRNISPAFSWSGVPEQARSLALIVEDPDAPMGTWTHWTMWGISTSVHELPEGMPRTATTEFGARQGRNDFNEIGYGGPCPPPGRSHRYFFRLYALDTVPDLKEGAGRRDLEVAIKRHVLAETAWMGTYKR